MRTRSILVLIFNEDLYLGAFINAVTKLSFSNFGFMSLKTAMQLHDTGSEDLCLGAFINAVMGLSFFNFGFGSLKTAIKCVPKGYPSPLLPIP